MGPHSLQRRKTKILQSVPAPDMEQICMLSPEWDKTFTMLGNPLLIWGKLTNLRTGTGCGKDLKYRRNSESKTNVLISCKGSCKNNSGSSTSLLWGPTEAGRLTTICSVGWPVKSLNPEQQFRPTPPAPNFPDAHLKQGLRNTEHWG